MPDVTRQGVSSAGTGQWSLVVLVLFYAVLQVVEGFSHAAFRGSGMSYERYHGLFVRGPWLAARAAPYFFLLTVRSGRAAVALAAGLAAAQLSCSLVLDQMLREIARVPAGFGPTRVVLSCFASLLVVWVLATRIDDPFDLEGPFVPRAIAAAAVFVMVAAGPYLLPLAFSVVSIPFKLPPPFGLSWL